MTTRRQTTDLPSALNAPGSQPSALPLVIGEPGRMWEGAVNLATFRLVGAYTDDNGKPGEQFWAPGQPVPPCLQGSDVGATEAEIAALHVLENRE